MPSWRQRPALPAGVLNYCLQCSPAMTRRPEKPSKRRWGVWEPPSQPQRPPGQACPQAELAEASERLFAFKGPRADRWLDSHSHANTQRLRLWVLAIIFLSCQGRNMEECWSYLRVAGFFPSPRGHANGSQMCVCVYLHPCDCRNGTPGAPCTPSPLPGPISCSQWAAAGGGGRKCRTCLNVSGAKGRNRSEAQSPCRQGGPPRTEAPPRGTDGGKAVGGSGAPCQFLLGQKHPAVGSPLSSR